jgi:pimeloyl-ACP methyl ester carboxylesterase
MAQRAPWLLSLPVGAMARSLRDDKKAARAVTKLMAEGPAADRVAYRDPEFAPPFLAATRDAFRTGTAGTVGELRMLARPWGFRLEDVRTHVDLFHGEQDMNVPVAIARRVVAALPDCNARFYPELGHLLAVSRRGEILDCVRAAS